MTDAEINDLISEKRCKLCGCEIEGLHHCIDRTAQRKAQVFALGQWLTDYPDEMQYDQVLALLQKDDNANLSDEWSEAGIEQWYMLDGHSGAQIAQFIEDTYEAAYRLLTE
jgi:hypothetical protein